MSRFVSVLATLAIALGCGARTATIGPDDSVHFVFASSHQEPIEPRELLSLDADELWQARNEIFARRGLEFTSERASQFFLQMPYYVPRSADVTLSEVERSNVQLIARFERYAAENPDLEFELAYFVSVEGSRGSAVMRSCPSLECEVTATLEDGCLVFGDYRLDEGSWVYALQSRCEGEAGPSGGYLERAVLILAAG